MKRFNPSRRHLAPKPKRKVMKIHQKTFDFLFMKSPDFRKDFAFDTNIRIETLANLTRRQALNVITVSRWKPFRKSFRRGKPFKISKFNPLGFGSVSWLKMIHVDAVVNYPLNGGYLIPIEPTLDFKKRHMSMNVGNLLWQVAQAYQNELYQYSKKYGIWGHSLGDLCFEVMILRKMDKKALSEISSYDKRKIITNWLAIFEVGS